VGKYAYGIRGSSLVAQVEQALGVGRYVLYFPNPNTVCP
jgi:hypothetical protein